VNFNSCALRKVVLHNAQIDKTVMIHDWNTFNHYGVALGALLNHLEVGLMQADKPGLGHKGAPGVDFNHVLSKSSTTQCPNR
jgi:hypothetical protein